MAIATQSRSLARRAYGWESVAAAAAACLGLLVSSGLLAIIAAGVIQWKKVIPEGVDDAIPLVVLGLGMALSGRVAVDVAGRRGWLATVITAAVIGLIGMAVQSAGEAHGDGISELQVGVAVAVVLVLTTGSALLVARRRARRLHQTTGQRAT